MALLWYTLVVDSHDLAAQARWWAETLDWKVGYEDDEAFEGDEVYEDEDDLAELAGIADGPADDDTSPSRRGPPRGAPTPRR